jgi:uncharacterized membrane protein (DUF485 family)
MKKTILTLSRFIIYISFAVLAVLSAIEIIDYLLQGDPINWKPIFALVVVIVVGAIVLTYLVFWMANDNEQTPIKKKKSFWQKILSNFPVIVLLIILSSCTSMKDKLDDEFMKASDNGLRCSETARAARYNGDHKKAEIYSDSVIHYADKALIIYDLMYPNKDITTPESEEEIPVTSNKSIPGYNSSGITALFIGDFDNFCLSKNGDSIIWCGDGEVDAEYIDMANRFWRSQTEDLGAVSSHTEKESNRYLVMIDIKTSGGVRSLRYRDVEANSRAEALGRTMMMLLLHERDYSIESWGVVTLFEKNK